MNKDTNSKKQLEKIIKKLIEKEQQAWEILELNTYAYVVEHFPTNYGFDKAINSEQMMTDLNLCRKRTEWLTLHLLLSEFGIEHIPTKKSKEYYFKTYEYLGGKQ